MEAFEINFKILFAQIVNFGIVLFLLKKFAYRPVLQMLEERKKKIAEAVSNAEKAAKDLENAEAAADKIREKAYLKAKEIMAEAKNLADSEAEKIIKKTNLQAASMIKFAEKEATEAKRIALSEARKQVGDLIILALEKILGSELDANQREKITAKAINDL